MQKTLVTAEQLVAMGPDSFYELVSGQLVAMPPASFFHGAVAARIVGFISAHVMEHGLGEGTTEQTGYRLQPDTVRVPDVAFVARERLVEIGIEGFAQLAPDLAVEVVSPNDSAEHMQQRARMWLEAGVRLVLVVYPEPRLVATYQHLREARLYLLGDVLTLAPVLPDLTLAVDDIFSGLSIPQP